LNFVPFGVILPHLLLSLSFPDAFTISNVDGFFQWQNFAWIKERSDFFGQKYS
jgi:hypothetical protein